MTDFPILSGGPGCRVYNSAALSINNTQLSDLTFDSERFDPSGMHSTATNTDRITISTPGVYLVVVNLEFASNATGRRVGILQVNGTTEIASTIVNAVSGDPTRIIVSTLWKFAANDYATIAVYQNSGSALNIAATSSQSPEFSAQYLGPG